MNIKYVYDFVNGIYTIKVKILLQIQAYTYTHTHIQINLKNMFHLQN